MAKKQTRKSQGKENPATSSEQSAPAPRPSGSDTSGDPPHQEIARRAHTLWLDGGCQRNCELQNWHEAEEQLRAERASRRQ